MRRGAGCVGLKQTQLPPAENMVCANSGVSEIRKNGALSMGAPFLRSKGSVRYWSLAIARVPMDWPLVWVLVKNTVRLRPLVVSAS